MTSRTDGAAYTSIERPDSFAVPDVALLPATEPAPQLTPEAAAPPSGFTPMPQTVTLGDLRREGKLRRDPTAPFNVSSVLTMAYVAGYGSRDPWQPFNVATVDGPQPSLPVPPSPASRLNLPQDPY